MNAAGLIAANDLRRAVRNRSALVLAVATPLLMAALIGLAFGGGFSFDADIALVDADRSPVS
jgi:hypothetical protein